MPDLNIGDYKIIGTLGEGGFGQVHQAVSATGTHVAIKVLHKESLGNEKVVKKFFHEAMILARLDHPNITRLFEFFPDGAAYAIVMEFIEGITLKDLILNQEGPIHQTRAINICLQILSAFQYAHENGIIHRDIKPGNIMIDKNGIIKIMDFGIAKFSSEASAETRTTWKWGAPHYMAPERFQEDGIVDMRSDIYSLGIVFYELFTGRKPFESSDTIRVIFCHLNHRPANPSDLRKNLPKHIGKAILKALEKEPSKRFASCDEFAAALAGGEKASGQFYQDYNPDEKTLLVEDAKIKKAFDKRKTIPVATVKKETSKKRPKDRSLFVPAVIIFSLIILVALGFFMQDDLRNFMDRTFSGIKGARQPVITQNQLGFSEVIHPKDGRAMVEIPSGEFGMGSELFEDEQPFGDITIDRYFMDKLPVTNADFARFVAETGFVTQAQKQGFGWVRDGLDWKRVNGAYWKNPSGQGEITPQHNELPVVQVSFEDAEAFCRWAQKRLPTEAQWEKAARGINGNTYPWGNAPPSRDFVNFANPDAGLWPIGRSSELSQSPFGVEDMAGNIYQWAQDWYAPKASRISNASGPVSGTHRVIKGGSYLEGPLSLRSANRDRLEPGFSSNLVGIRCACTQIPSK